MTEPTVLRWETLTKRKFDQLDREKCVVLVTCSPIEVHGPHLPMAADALQGEGLGQRMVRMLPPPHNERVFLQLPFIYAVTDTVPQPGSLFFRPSTTIAVLEDLGRSLAAQGFRDIVISNFHGSPRHFLAIEKACATVSAERNVRMVCIFSVLISRLTNGTAELYGVLDDIPGINAADLVGDTHGGLVETAQLLALHPEWVERDYAKLPRQTVDTWLEGRGESPPAIKAGRPGGIWQMLKAFEGGVRFFKAETYAGAPGSASPEIGEQILDKLAGEAALALTEIFEGRLPPEKWHSPLWSKRFLFINSFMVRFFNRVLRIADGVT